MREQLRQKYEDAAWTTATRVISVCLESGAMAEAKRQAQEAIINWQEEGKTEIIGRFKEWLKSKDIDLDDINS